jgi:hypothetical protein
MNKCVKYRILMINFQLDLFNPTDEVEILRKELIAVKESSDKVRKGMFARHNELAKMYLEMKDRVDVLENFICKNKTNHSLGQKSESLSAVVCLFPDHIPMK